MAQRRDSSRERLQAAAKVLFAERGYESTTVAAILQRAQTSYSQFGAHFSDKNGVLAAILAEGWDQISSAIRLATARVASPGDSLQLALDILLSYMERDPAFQTIALLERPGTNGGKRHAETGGQSDFLNVVDEIFEQMMLTGELSAQVQPRMARAALLGALESMLRDRLLSSKSDVPNLYDENDIRALLETFLASVESPIEAPGAKPEPPLVRGIDVEVDQDWIEHYLQLASLALGSSGRA